MEDILKKNGFKIISRRLNGEVELYYDHQKHSSPAPADFLVKKEKKTYVVHVNDLMSAADPTAPGLKLKLLESSLVYKPDGLIILDLSDRSLRQVEFKFKNPRDFLDSIFRIVMGVFIVLVFLGIIWLMNYLKLF